MDVGEGSEQLGVEAGRALMPFPAGAGTHHLVDAVLGERRDETREVSVVLRLRMRLPELADLLVLVRVDGPPQQLQDALARHGHLSSRGRWSPRPSFATRHSASASAYGRMNRPSAHKVCASVGERARRPDPARYGSTSRWPGTIVVPASRFRFPQLPDALARIAGEVRHGDRPERVARSDAVVPLGADGARVAREERPDDDDESGDGREPDEHVFALCTNTCSVSRRQRDDEHRPPARRWPPPRSGRRSERRRRVERGGASASCGGSASRSAA